MTFLAPIILALATAVAAAAPGSWLDAKTPPQWNAGTLQIPLRAGPADAEFARGGRCATTVRPPTAAEDRAVVARGWTLFGTYQRFGPLVVVTAASGSDGMCRPSGYQGFVFVDGAYAGSISPKLMDSRTDGALSGLGIAVYDAHDFTAEFTRYNVDDALCCPHATTYVTYEVRTVGGIARVVAVSSSTQKTPA